MILRHPLWFPWGRVCKQQLAQQDCRKGRNVWTYMFWRLKEQKLLTYWMWGAVKSLRHCPGLRCSPEWMVGPLPKTGSLGEVTLGTDSSTLAVCSSVWLGPHVWAGPFPDGTVGLVGKERLLTSGPGQGPQGEASRGHV